MCEEPFRKVFTHHICLKIYMISKFAFCMLVNHLTCKRCPVLGMRLSFGVCRITSGTHIEIR